MPSESAAKEKRHDLLQTSIQPRKLNLPTEGRTQAIEESSLASALEFMLPDADHFPIKGAKLSVDLMVTHAVTENLFFPKDSIPLGPSTVLGAPVPKASINKHSGLQLWKNKVRFTRQLGASSPALDAVFPEDLYQPQLSVFIARSPNAGHYIGSFLLRENV